MELLGVVAIAAIMMAVGIPAYQAMIRNNQMSTQINDFVTSLVLARSEAVKGGVTAAVCKSGDGATCSAGQWEDGWIVFINTDNDIPAQVDAGEPILRTYGPMKPGFTLRSNGALEDFIVFDNRGISGPGLGSGRFVLCKNDALEGSRAVFISTTGRPRLALDGDDNGIPDDTGGGDIDSCDP